MSGGEKALSALALFSLIIRVISFFVILDRGGSSFAGRKGQQTLWGLPQSLRTRTVSSSWLTNRKGTMSAADSTELPRRSLVFPRLSLVVGQRFRKYGEYKISNGYGWYLWTVRSARYGPSRAFWLASKKDMYFAIASVMGPLVAGAVEEVRNEIISFIAENGSLVEFHGEDLYEATMPRDFYPRFFDKLQESPYVNVNELLLTGKRACYVLETADPLTYLSFSASHIMKNIQKVALLILRMIFSSLRPILLRTKLKLVKLGSMRVSMELRQLAISPLTSC